MLAQFFWGSSADAHLIKGEYDPLLVILSLAVCWIASGQALRHASFARSATSRQLRYWSIVSGSLALGIGIWAMHFIGMLAYSLHAAVQYDLTVTVLSIIPGIAASAVALALLTHNELNLRQLILGGLAVGIGIAAMHYCGMAAMRTPATHQYSAAWVFISLVVGVALATLALWVRFGLARFKLKQDHWRKTLAAVTMGAAISGMHYTAMLALRVTSDHEIHDATTSNDRLILALTIALITLLFGGLIAQANALIHYRSRWQKVDMNEARLQALVNMAADGIICIDNQGRVTDYNPAAEVLFGWSPGEVLGKNVKMLMPAALVTQHDAYLEQHEAGQRNNAPPLQNKISEVLGQHKDGTLVPMRLALSQAEARGQRMYVGLLTNLSDRKRTERQLHIAATVFDHSHEGMVVLDANRKIVDINPAFSRISGLKRQAAKNKEFASLFIRGDDDSDVLWSQIWTEIGRKGHWQGPCVMQHDMNRHQISLTAVRDEQQRLHHYIAVCYQSIDIPLGAAF
ncbi:MHYT domain-containing protein [Comamonas testosteroni]|uniref:Putative PAS/PAC sensor protein n=1 Tax=Comamonas testosteroni (strain DSM 14576 / KF-1) TaxID=399795 RepID=B7WSQ0_COMTK|nr:MHYT domain-containing protein [Comamonas testosteroni]EED67344.1 putative PAS/PAC sensor protein [Comamonas testosteroni KF-1]WQG65513.1 MHYT domain-containing protein [Comamonas testosteroni]